MPVRFWLRGLAHNEEGKLAVAAANDHISLLHLDMKIKRDERSALHYIQISYDPASPTPLLPNEEISHVTATARIWRGFRHDGIYRHHGAELTLITEPDEHGRRSQLIFMSALTLGCVKEIYTLVRQGKLQPDEDWEAPQAAPPPTASPTPEPNAA